MKILVVCQHYWPETFQITDICEELAARGHDVTVLAGLPNYPKGKVSSEYRHGKNRRQIRNGVKIIRAHEIGRGRNPVKLALNYYSYSISAKRIARKLPGDFDVVFSYMLSPVTMVEPAVAYAEANNTPLLLYCCDLWPESMKVILGNRLPNVIEYYRGVSQRLYGAADIIDVQSPEFHRYFDEILDLGAKRIEFVPQFATGEFLDEDFDTIHEGVHFVILGNIGRAQDADVILKAVANMKTTKTFQVHFVGEGPMHQKAIDLSRELKIDHKVVFHGRRPNAEMPNYYRMADACILALNGDTWVGTTLPSRLQGYMAAGKPVIAAVNGGARTVIQEADCGIAVPAGDVEGLANALDGFVENPGRFIQCGANGREYFRNHFTKKRYMDTIERQLCELCERN